MAPNGLGTALADESAAPPCAVRERGAIYVGGIARFTGVVGRLSDALEAAPGTDATLRRRRTIPGAGQLPVAQALQIVIEHWRGS